VLKKVYVFTMLLAALIVGAIPALAADGTPTREPDILMEEEKQSENWNLLLVNPWNKLPDDYTIELKKLKNGLQVDVRIYDDLNAMLTDCRAAGLQPIVCSAYRPLTTQQRLYRNKIARLRAAGYSEEAAVQEAGRWVAVPGTSEHQTGMALDIVAASYQVLDQRQEQTAEQKWLMEHCWDYGFVLRYPADKCDITGIGYEPWHYRYVGREAAAVMRDKSICLEEYLAGTETKITEEIPTESDEKTLTETAAETPSNEQETANAVS